jgi:hypothetical protein
MINGKNFIAIPRITTAERTALPAYNGLLVYDTDLNAFYKFENGAWSGFAGGGGGAVSSVFGRTGAVTAQSGDYSKSDVGLSNVDNTSDVNKPISTATQTALNAKQNIPIIEALNSAIDISSATPVLVYSKALTGLAIGDVVRIRMIGNINNNSGGAKTYTHFFQIGSFVISIADAAGIAASATNESVHELNVIISITATNFTSIFGEINRGVPGAIDTGQSIATTTVRKGWNETTNNLSGSQTFSYSVGTTAAAATQTFKMRAVIIDILKNNP